MIEKPRVLLDCDGVLASFAGGFLDVANRLLGTAHRPEDLDRWDICKCLGISSKHEEQIYEEVGKEGFVLGLQVLPGAIDGVRELSRIAEVYVVTSPTWSSRHWMAERTEWLARHFAIPARRVIHTSDKFLIHGHALIDDRFSHVEAWHKEWVISKREPNAMAVLWDQPSNRDDYWPIATRDWGKLCSMISSRFR